MDGGPELSRRDLPGKRPDILSDEIHCDLLRSGLRHTPLASLFPESRWIVTCMAPSKTFNIAGLHFSELLDPRRSAARRVEQNAFRGRKSSLADRRHRRLCGGL